MPTIITLPTRFPVRSVSLIFLILIFAAWSAAIATEGTSNIVRVEEDWSLNVLSPVQGIVAPQLTTVISPTGDTNSYYAVLAINHRALPDFAGGGLQLQLWRNDTAESYTNFHDDSMLNYREAQESITWTQAVQVNDGILTFEILNGNSQTWGQFGGDDLQISVPTGLTDLNSYSPAVSAGNSGISYAKNRVRSLTINRVRLIDAAGHVTEYSNLTVVYPHAEQ
jgi:hypothetical protein